MATHAASHKPQPAASAGMSEGAKTGIFVAIAALVLLAALLPSLLTRSGSSTASDEQGKFFPEFESVTQAKALTIQDYDEAKAVLPKEFRIDRGADGLWKIASHSNYPADAEKHFAEAAATLVGVDKVGVAAREPGLHAEYGVIEPDSAVLKGGETGVGRRVSLLNDNKEPIASFIIGKKVEGSKDANLRYIRVPGQNHVFVASLDTSKLTTKFSDWIEADLLQLKSFDVKGVVYNNYTFDLDELRKTRKLPPADVLQLQYDNAGFKWTMEGLAETEEIDSTKLNDMKNALDDLKIVDVERKPAVFQDGLTLDPAIFEKADVFQSLMQRGFMPLQFQGQAGEVVTQVFSTEGDMEVQMKDGVSYTLRFGQLTLSSATGSEEDQEKKSSDEFKGSNRYLFVMASFNPALVDEPKYEPLPGEAGPAAPEETKQPEEGAKPEEPKPDESKPSEESAKPEESAAEPEKKELQEQQDPDAEQTPPVKNEEPAQAEPSQDEPKAEPPKAEPAKPDPAAEKAELERIEKENARKRTEYETKLTEGQKRVDELNKRFGPWYYVISDDVYRKLRLSRSDIIKPKQVKAEDIKPTTPGAANPLDPAPPEEK